MRQRGAPGERGMGPFLLKALSGISNIANRSGMARYAPLFVDDFRFRF
jgi:hypothetical protein